MSGSHLQLVPPTPDDTVVAVPLLWLELAAGTAKITPAADAPDCTAHLPGDAAGYIVRQTLRDGRALTGPDGQIGEDVAMFPCAGMGRLAAGMAAAIGRRDGCWAIADTVFACGHRE